MRFDDGDTPTKSLLYEYFDRCAAEERRLYEKLQRRLEENQEARVTENEESSHDQLACYTLGIWQRLEVDEDFWNDSQIHERARPYWETLKLRVPIDQTWHDRQRRWRES